METRTITQVKIYELVLNPMSDRAESRQTAAIAYSKEDLIKYINEQKADAMYKDDRFNKTFKKDSPLEWYNPLRENEFDNPGTFGHGIFADWAIQEDVERFCSVNNIVLIK